MADKIFENNQVSIVGEIVSDFRFSHEVYGEGFYVVDVAVNRLSNFMDYIPLMISERLIDVNEDYIGQTIYVMGQFRSFNRHEEKKNRLVLSVFVRELELLDEIDEEPDFSGWLHLQRSDLPENTAWKRDCRPFDRSEPLLWKIRLYSMHLLGKKCKVCIRF